MEYAQEIGLHLYEIGVYKGKSLEEIFSTDSKEPQIREALVQEARSRKDFLKKENPQEKYKIRKVDPSLKIINYSCF